jgi:hypothetical protein
MKCLGTLTAVSVLLCLTALAVAKDSPAAHAASAGAEEVKPSTEGRTDPLSPFVAAWDCKGTLYPVGGANQPSHFLWTFERSTGGWLHLIARLAEPAKASDLMSGLQYMGYDRLTNEVLIFGIDDEGGTWTQSGLVQADGKFTVQGPYRRTDTGKLLASRDTWQVTGGKLLHTGETEDHGRFHINDDEICTKK